MASGAAGSEVFISYARQASAEAARVLHGALQSVGVSAFLDESDIEVGGRFRTAIVDGTLTYDPVNERILVQQGDGVFAFAVGTGEWTTLLEPPTE